MNFFNKKIFFGIRISNFNERTIINFINKIIVERHKTILLPLNVDCFNISIKDKNYRKILLDNKYVVYIDGMGIAMGMKYLTNFSQPRIATTDLIKLLLKKISEKELGHRIGFIGGQSGSAKKCKEFLNKKYNISNVVYSYEPKIINTNELLTKKSLEKIQKYVDKINEQKLDILFVGLGCPKQEIFTNLIYNRVNVNVFIPCGGLFNYYAGIHKRAPIWLQNLGMEWIFRLILEPKRLWKRYIIGNFKYLMVIFKKNIKYE